MKKSIAMFLSLAVTSTMLHAQHKNPKEPPPPPPPPPKMETVKSEPPVIINDKELQAFYDRNPDVDQIKWRSNEKVVIVFKDKNKKNEEYNVSKEAEENAFRNKYGDLPTSPPPPPPPPPLPKKKLQ